jgi:hypothetical protein
MKRRPIPKKKSEKKPAVAKTWCGRLKAVKKRQLSPAEVEESLLSEARRRILAARERAKKKAAVTKPGKRFEVKTKKTHSRAKALSFDPDFVPIDRRARRLRHKLLGIGILRLPGGRVLRPVDAFVAAELRRQEEAGVAALEELVAALGKGANWRDALIFEAKTNMEAFEELARRRAFADSHCLSREREEFEKAAERVRQLRRAGPASRARLEAMIFGLKHEEERGELPTRKATKDYLLSKGIAFPASSKKDGIDTGNNDRRFFSGSYLSKFPVARPWHGREPLKPRKKLRG